MFKTLAVLHLLMARTGLAIAVLVAALSTHAAPAPDLATAIRTIANEHTAGRSITPAGTTYHLYAYRAPRGYRTVITLVEPHNAPPVVMTTIYESIGGEQHATLLIDTGADGQLDGVVTAHERTRSGAQQRLRENTIDTPTLAHQHEYTTLMTRVQQNAAYTESLQ